MVSPLQVSFSLLTWKLFQLMAGLGLSKSITLQPAPVEIEEAVICALDPSTFTRLESSLISLDVANMYDKSFSFNLICTEMLAGSFIFIFSDYILMKILNTDTYGVTFSDGFPLILLFSPAS